MPKHPRGEAMADGSQNDSRHAVAKGQLPTSAAKPKRIRIRDVAEYVGVSESAVSFALNQKPGISDSTRARILDAVEDLGWTPNHAARALSGARSATIGFVVARSPHDVGAEAFFIELMAGMQEVFSREYFGLLFQVVQDVTEEIALYRRWISENRVDGIVLVDLRDSDPRVSALAELGLPAVLAGGPDTSGQLTSVAIDDTAAMALVLDHLKALGHINIGYISGDRKLAHIAKRTEVVKEYAKQTGLKITVVPTDFSTRAATKAVVQVLDRDPKVSALVFDNEVLAVAGIGLLNELKIQIPTEMAVVSLEDSLICTAMRPQVTALHRDTYLFGKAVAERLLHQITGRKMTMDQPEPPWLEVRQSTDESAEPKELAVLGAEN